MARRQGAHREQVKIALTPGADAAIAASRRFAGRVSAVALINDATIAASTKRDLVRALSPRVARQVEGQPDSTDQATIGVAARSWSAVGSWTACRCHGVSVAVVLGRARMAASATLPSGPAGQRVADQSPQSSRMRRSARSKLGAVFGVEQLCSPARKRPQRPRPGRARLIAASQRSSGAEADVVPLAALDRHAVAMRRPDCSVTMRVVWLPMRPVYSKTVVPDAAPATRLPTAAPPMPRSARLLRDCPSPRRGREAPPTTVPRPARPVLDVHLPDGGDAAVADRGCDRLEREQGVLSA